MKAMKSITASAFRARIGQFVDEASAGERIVIERKHRPIAVLVPYTDRARLDAIDEERADLSPPASDTRE